MTATTTKRTELASFLRDRRAKIAPADVGLPDGSRRRTPGLRREEVAQLADVGTSWYTWLEQGRDIHVSEAFLERLARALRLTPAERSHLFGLAQGRSPRHGTLPAETVSEALQRTIDAHPHPAVVTTPRWDVVTSNAAARAVWGDRRGTNSLWRAFTEANPCGLDVREEAHARRLVARFRAEAARAADREPFDQLVTELADVSPEFHRLWSEQGVSLEPEGAKVVHHPDVGTIELDHVALLHVEPDGRTLRVTLYTPRPGESAERLARFVANGLPLED